MKKYIALWLACIFVFAAVVPVCAAGVENKYGCSDWAIESVNRAFSRQLLDESKSYHYQQNIT
ncbi:MAG: hypothetical protein IJD83_08195, partial [Clostridia bacterium]|nr:hypothetical protein [Clostridia bacterium]